ncbi:hypothetical protein SRIMHP_07445 [Streptomyces rimosus subsp. rimosus]|uniref:Uncharacterized protein n=1 Tax=Streptomyces rimosus subsp. rimosus TaxID=132474 RepID=A0ABY3YWG4_STRRM|nr:hypothetical protein SRIMR7_09615 [Streptomyces rimosus subsp. rimosus]UTH93957.1 hypothetical protein SRIMHP_07445 [Streptomyces rimosus subsp. rimosus]UTJ12052.1 hypothetical protein SRIMDV3_07340 [Streptomyces rimosus subsp. rimosus]
MPESTGWKPSQERPMWPWVVAAIVAVAVVINVIITI